MDIAGGLVWMYFYRNHLYFCRTGNLYCITGTKFSLLRSELERMERKFKMYKFRSMYMDAEERKAELMKDNKLGDGKMFKLDFDPRVIGNKILPDGTHKTGIGEFYQTNKFR